MTRITSQRGISLLVLIIMITVFAGVALGFVRLLRTRHESYPYQVQSYQAYTLAHAGVEFATRYAGDNQSGFIINPAAYIPQTSYRDFSFGNGTFSLRYVPGCPDKLYSRGTCGTATREVEVSDLGLLGRSNSVYLSSEINYSAIPFVENPVYPGDRIAFTFCDPSQHPVMNGWSWIVMDSITIAADKPGVTIMRIGTNRGGASVPYEWVYDGACGAPCVGFGQFAGTTLPVWDGISDPPNASATPPWNAGNSYNPSGDQTCRPHQPHCPTDNTLGCNIYPPDPIRTRTYVTCTMSPIRTRAFGLDYGQFVIETYGSIAAQLPVKFYVSFLHIPAGANFPDYSKQVLNKFIFTIDH